MNDHVVRPVDSQHLRTAIEQNDGKSVFPGIAHPFKDSPAMHLARMAIIKRYLRGETAK